MGTKEKLKVERLAVLLPLGFQFESDFDVANLSESMFQSFKLGLETAKKEKEAPRKQKLNNWIDGLAIVTPSGMNEDETVIEILEKFEAFQKWAKIKIETL